MQPPNPERELLPAAPPGHLAASKVWLGSISKLHRQQLKGPLLPRFHRATWQQVEIPETSLALGLHSPQGSLSARVPACCPLLALPSGGGRAEHFLCCHHPAAQGRGRLLPLLASTTLFREGERGGAGGVLGWTRLRSRMSLS